MKSGAAAAAASGSAWVGIGDMGINSAGMAAMAAGTYGLLETTAGGPHMAQDYRIMSLLDSKEVEQDTHVSASNERCRGTKALRRQTSGGTGFRSGPTLGWSLAS